MPAATAQPADISVTCPAARGLGRHFPSGAVAPQTNEQQEPVEVVSSLPLPPDRRAYSAEWRTANDVTAIATSVIALIGAIAVLLARSQLRKGRKEIRLDRTLQLHRDGTTGVVRG